MLFYKILFNLFKNQLTIAIFCVIFYIFKNIVTEQHFYIVVENDASKRVETFCRLFQFSLAFIF